MDWSRFGRPIAVVVGAGIVFVLGQLYDLSYWVSIPLGVAAYIGILLLTGHIPGAGGRGRG